MASHIDNLALESKKREPRSVRWKILVVTTLATTVVVSSCFVSNWQQRNITAFTWSKVDRYPSEEYPGPQSDELGIYDTGSSPTEDHRPPLQELIGDNETNITGDVQFLLDFAIIGHSKTGTSSLMYSIGHHPQVKMNVDEVRCLKTGQPAALVRLLYAFPPGSQYKRGYKSPNDIRDDTSLNALRTYWPKTKLIVGLRHPVHWFNSFYNFKTRRGRTRKMKAEEMVGEHLPDQVYYHVHLAMLGKTNLSDSAELLGLDSDVDQPPFMPNEVFLYDVSQPFDRNITRAETYWKDLSDFIGLYPPLKPRRVREKTIHNNIAIDICDSKFMELRKELVEVGSAASEWILTYFIDLPGVTISQRDHFVKSLLTWSQDPCDNATTSSEVDRYPLVIEAQEPQRDEPAVLPLYNTNTSLAVGHRPPLSELIGDNKTTITDDVQFLLDFAIIGHSKTGTSTLMHRIQHHEQVKMPPNEVHFLTRKQPAALVSLLYALPPGRQYKRGYKAPNDICKDQALHSIRTYWPKTRLIVGVRHPVHWFNSFYNFKSRQGKMKTLKAEEMVGERLPSQVRYHVHLAMLGKTNLSDSAELLGLDGDVDQPPHMPNKVFLYDISQPFDRNTMRAETYWKDLSNFIGLSPPLTPPTVREKSRNDNFAINICDDKFVEVRNELTEVGRAASEWILTYFVKLPDVTVSQRDHFTETLLTWSQDPCDDSKNAADIQSKL